MEASTTTVVSSTASSERSAASVPERRSEGLFSDRAYTMALHCLFSMVLAAAVMGLLNGLGVVAPSESRRCPEQPDNPGYGGCHVKQDLRAVLSFVLGALVTTVGCGPSTPDSRGSGFSDTVRKVESYAGLL
eukprot:TRINITY_DN80877_c0_g1_i1.p1 TRINITY_DN80877_c0_g1~~TRINITY_DN80877_c0_g1_i1.p1  ORF type:complete len:132 (-),score=18.79 TRINITY_DN80877_c0_g1_i1:268-663(-)